MDKLDFKKRDKALYSGKVGRIDRLMVPPMNYLMIDGEGGPVGQSYPPSLAALYGLSYGLKFLSKTECEKDFVVGPLQGLWWAEDMNTFITRQKDQWLWTMMIRQPEWLTQEHLEQVRAQTIAKNAKKKEPLTSETLLRKVRLASYDEGDCVQVLHVGSYDDEGPILDKMHNEYIPEHGLKMQMKHHEIYLNDPRRLAPEKLKTVLRQPVTPL